MAREEHDERTSHALESLGEILHGVYDNRNGMTTVGQETALLEAYVDIMKLRFGNSFQYYNVDVYKRQGQGVWKCSHHIFQLY